MDLSYLTAVIRSTHLPPYDPWFAGGYLNYYYFGQFVIATMVRLTGIVPEVSFNLAIPMLWTMTLGAAFSIVYNLTEALHTGRLAGRRLRKGPVSAGLAAAALVGLAGNLDGGIQVFQSLRRGIETGMWETVRMVLTGTGFEFWRSSRMIAVPGSISITEFPLFTFLFADLHAHLFAMPITLLAVGLALAIALAIRQGGGFKSYASLIAILSLAVGSLLATNAWDYPTYLALGPGAISVAVFFRTGNAWKAIVVGGAALAVVGVASYAAFTPFHATNISFYTDIVRSPEQTPIRSYVAIFGLPLFIVTAALVVFLWRAFVQSPLPKLRRISVTAAPTGAIALGGTAESVRAWTAALIGVGLGLAITPVWVAGYRVVAINLVLAIGFGLAVLSRRAELPVRLAFALAALAVILIAGIDIFAVDDRLVRMNTIFRVYLQAWVLLGLSSAFLLWWLTSQGAFRRLITSPAKGLFAVILVILVAAASVYPVYGTKARLADRFEPLPLTLDGLAFTADAAYRDLGDVPVALRWEREGIEWLRQNVTGSPVVAEAVVPPAPNDVTYFRFLSRVAVYTGLPVVIGWPWHQTQQRGIGRAEPLVAERLADVRQLYSSRNPDEIRSLLNKYAIRYIFVGQLERLYYGPDVASAFQHMPELEVIRINPYVEIFRVSPE